MRFCYPHRPTTVTMNESDEGDAFSNKILRALVHGEGSFFSFLSSSSSSHPLRHLLIRPFTTAVGEDGLLRMCRLTNHDDWSGAKEVVQQQVSMCGGPDIKLVANGSSVKVDGVEVHRLKRVMCSRSGVPDTKSSAKSSARCNSRKVSHHDSQVPRTAQTILVT